jgi:hypothetical protein
MPSAVYATGNLEFLCLSVYILITCLNYILHGLSCFACRPRFTNDEKLPHTSHM